MNDKTDIKLNPETRKYEPVRDDKGQFVKGTSGNPGGKPKGARTFASILRALLNNEDIDAVDMAGFTEQDKLMLGLIKKAKETDLKALEMIVDRMDGKSVAKQDVNINTNSPFDEFNDNEA